LASSASIRRRRRARRSTHVPPPAITGGLDVIRRGFEEAGYTPENLVRTLGPEAIPGIGTPEHTYLIRLTRDPTPLNTLIHLFLLGIPVPEKAAVAALSREFLEAVCEARLAEPVNGALCGRVRVQAFRGLFLACDSQSYAGPEQVMGITSSTVVLADSTVPRHSRSTLDLGAGCGVLGLLAARHSGRVLATDLSGRSIAFTQFNAALNGIANVSTAAGSGFEPVGRECFDLIVANPPFAVSPDRRVLYRDSGMAGDTFVRQLITQAPRFLNEGGFAQLLCDCISYAGLGWRDRIAGWVDGTGCDAWILATGTQAPAQYARDWVRETEPGSRGGGSALFHKWLDSLEKARVESITNVLVALRRRSGQNYCRIEDAPEWSGGFGAEIALGFELCDYANSVTDAGLLAERLSPHPHLRLQYDLEAAGGAWRITEARLHVIRGLCWKGQVDSNASTLLAACDGSRTFADVCARVAAAAEASLERVVPGCLSLARKLIARGYLRPSGL